MKDHINKEKMMIKFANFLVLSFLFSNFLIGMQQPPHIQKILQKETKKEDESFIVNQPFFTEEDKQCYAKLRNAVTHSKGHYWDAGFNLVHPTLTKTSVEALAGEFFQVPSWQHNPLRGTVVFGETSYPITGKIASIMYNWQKNI